MPVENEAQEKKGDEALVYIKHLLEANEEEHAKEEGSALLPTNTRQIRYRDWVKSGAFNEKMVKSDRLKS